MRAVSAVSDFRYLIVPHTHWDREWYVPFEVFRLRLGRVVDGVLDVLERDEAFSCFTLDGQAVVLEDYLEVRPEEEARLRALLAAGRLEVGPWYVLADELLVGGEALVRNLLVGRRVCRRFGVEPTAVGYAPDSFGHPSQLPQVLAGFGIGTFFFSAVWATSSTMSASSLSGGPRARRWSLTRRCRITTISPGWPR